MKKTYSKPQRWVMATATNELLLQQTSWGVHSTNGDEPGTDDRGNIIYDDENFGEGEYDPWNSDNW